MAYAVVHEFAGGTEAQYRASIAAVHPSDGSLPNGQLFHAAGPSADGWMIVAVHESRESWERFRDGILAPQLARGIEGELHGASAREDVRDPPPGGLLSDGRPAALATARPGASPARAARAAALGAKRCRAGRDRAPSALRAATAPGRRPRRAERPRGSSHEA